MEKKDNKEHVHKVHKSEGANESAVSFDAKTIVMIVLVGLLIVVSGIQALELSSLKGKLSEEGVKLSSATQKTSIGASGSSGGSLSKNLDSLPTMVGGC